MSEVIANGVMDAFFDKWATEKVAWIAEMKDRYHAEHDAIDDLSSAAIDQKARLSAYHESEEHNRIWAMSVGYTILDWLQVKPVYDTPRCKDSINTLIRKEIEKRKKDFYAKVEKKVGEIIEVDLHLGVDGTPNGTVVGTNGKAVVTTISAGGHNIQCFHYRVLVK